MTNYFLDTYALISIIRGVEGYKKFLSSTFFTTIYNLYEFYYILLRDNGEEIAKKYYLEFKEIQLEIEDEHIFLASRFRLLYRKKKFSYADCLGYTIAIEKNIKFLTGDKEFEGLENVEFVREK